jgi:hypothetical protein
MSFTKAFKTKLVVPVIKELLKDLLQQAPEGTEFKIKTELSGKSGAGRSAPSSVINAYLETKEGKALSTALRAVILDVPSTSNLRTKKGKTKEQKEDILKAIRDKAEVSQDLSRRLKAHFVVESTRERKARGRPRAPVVDIDAPEKVNVLSTLTEEEKRALTEKEKEALEEFGDDSPRLVEDILKRLRRRVRRSKMTEAERKEEMRRATEESAKEVREQTRLGQQFIRTGDTELLKRIDKASHAFLKRQRERKLQEDRDFREAQRAVEVLREDPEERKMMRPVEEIIREAEQARRGETKREAAEVEIIAPKVTRVRREVKVAQPTTQGVSFREATGNINNLDTVARVSIIGTTRIRQLLDGSLSLQSLLENPAVTANQIRNIANGLGVMALGLAGGFSPIGKRRAMDLLEVLGLFLQVNQDTDPVFKKAAENFDREGRVKEDRVRKALRRERKMPAPEGQPEGKGLRPPDEQKAERLIKSLKDTTVEQKAELESKTGVQVEEATQLVEQELKESKLTGQPTQNLNRILTAFTQKGTLMAFLGTLAGIQLLREVEDPTDVLERQATATEARVPVREPGVRTETMTLQRAMEEERTRVRQRRRDPRPEGVRTATETIPREEDEDEPPIVPPITLPTQPPTRKPTEKPPVFKPKKLQLEEQDKAKDNQQARPAYIIPSKNVLDPHQNIEAQKAEFDAQAGFGFDIPYAMNNVILENNPLMQQRLIEEKLRYDKSGLYVGVDDWNSVFEKQIEKPVNPDTVPRMIFREDYQQMPYNPNVTMVQNIAYNDYTNILPEDPQEISIMTGTLEGVQP